MTPIRTDPIGEPVNEGRYTHRVIDRAFKAWCERRKFDEPELRHYVEDQVRKSASRRNRRKKS